MATKVESGPGALLGFSLPKEAYVATGTAVALIVDDARMPVYFATQWNGISSKASFMLVAIAGVLAGTYGGVHILRRMSEKTFRRSVSGLITALGMYMMFKGFGVAP